MISFSKISYISNIKFKVNHLETIIFGSNYKELISSYKNTNLEKIEHNNIYAQILTQLHNIKVKSTSLFSKFILSPQRQEQYVNCRDLKKVVDLDKLLEKFVLAKDYNHIVSHTKQLLSHIDMEGYKYYAIANTLEGSDLSVLPAEVIGHVFYYVDGEIEI